MRRFVAFLERHPTPSFLIILGLLFLIILFASSTRTPETSTEIPEKAQKTSRVFSLRESGFVMATAQVKKTDVIDVVANTTGIVQSLRVKVGQKVSAGTALVHLTNDYGAETGRLIAEKSSLQNDLTDRLYSLQKDILEREKRIARNDDDLTDREEKNTIKNLKIELERLKVNREVAKLDAALAQASDAQLNPKTIFNGTVEFIGVRPGETITPGTVIATIRGTTDHATLTASLPDRIAHVIDPRGVATLFTDTGDYSLTGGYLAQGENTLGLRSITFPLTPELSHQLTNSEFVNIFLPLINPSNSFFIPIDAIFSGAQDTTVLVLDEAGLVVQKSVRTGQVVGSFVLVTEGLSENDTLLLNRNLTPGDNVQVVQ